MGIENKLIHYFLEHSFCTEEDIENAKSVKAQYNAKIGLILLNSGVISESQYLQALSTLLNIKIIDEDFDIQYIELDNVENTYFTTNKIYPFFENENEVYFALGIELNYEAILKIETNLQKKTIVFFAKSDILERLHTMYLENIDVEYDEGTIERLKELASEAPVIKMINNHFLKAVEENSSDIHYESNEKNMRVRIRVDGVMKTIDTISNSYKTPIIARLKLLSKMNISEKRLPQDGRISTRIGNKEVDIRCSSVPTEFGESFVLRLLGKASIEYSLEGLHFFEDHMKLLKELTAKPNGIFLTTGPTGSGKTTTLYSLLNHINNDNIKIITVEDPVEYQLDGINQIQVKEKIDFTFNKALRSILRQDPDIIMVGEIRDKETAEIAIQSALTGHFVLSTLHTNSAVGAITRLLDMKVEYFLLKASVVGLMAQRLVRKLCPHCKTPIEVDPNLKDILDIDKLLSKYNFVNIAPCKNSGCKECDYTGYKGRLPVAEIVPFDHKLQDKLQEDQSFRDISSLGYRTLFEDAVLKYLNGDTTYEEIMRLYN